MGVFDRQIEVAKRLIAKNGQSVIWRTLVDGPLSDPDEPWNPSEAVPSENNVKIVFLPYSASNNQFIKYLKGTNVTEGALTGLMAQVTFEPKAKDTVIRGTKELAIKTIDELSPNGQSILWFVEFEL